MAGKDNLKKGNPETQFKSGRQAVENGRKGGKASAKSKREKKALKETLEELLSMPLKDGTVANIDEIGSIAEINGKNITMQEAIILSMLNKAVKGNVRAAEYVRDTIGEFPGAAEQQARIDKLKAETARIKGEDTDTDQDDGFIEALKGEVADTWDE